MQPQYTTVEFTIDDPTGDVVERLSRATFRTYERALSALCEDTRADAIDYYDPATGWSFDVLNDQTSDIKVESLSWEDTINLLEITAEAIRVASNRSNKDYQDPVLPELRVRAQMLGTIRCQILQVWQGLKRRT